MPSCKSTRRLFADRRRSVWAACPTPPRTCSRRSSHRPGGGFAERLRSRHCRDQRSARTPRCSRRRSDRLHQHDRTGLRAVRLQCDARSRQESVEPGLHFRRLVVGLGGRGRERRRGRCARVRHRRLGAHSRACLRHHGLEADLRCGLGARHDAAGAHARHHRAPGPQRRRHAAAGMPIMAELPSSRPMLARRGARRCCGGIRSGHPARASRTQLRCSPGPASRSSSRPALAAIEAIDRHAMIVMQGESARVHRARIDDAAIAPVLRRRLAKGLEIADATLAESVGAPAAPGARFRGAGAGRKRCRGAAGHGDPDPDRGRVRSGIGALLAPDALRAEPLHALRQHARLSSRRLARRLRRSRHAHWRADRRPRRMRSCPARSCSACAVEDRLARLASRPPSPISCPNRSSSHDPAHRVLGALPPARARSDARPRRADLLPHPGRFRRRRDQDRGAARRRSERRHQRCAARLRHDQPAPQQALDDAQPEGERRARRIHAPGRDGRYRGREFSPRREGPAGRRLRGAEGSQPAHHPRVDLGLRAERSLQDARRIRPDRPGHGRADGRHRRARHAADARGHRRRRIPPPACSPRRAF